MNFYTIKTLEDRISQHFLECQHFVYGENFVLNRSNNTFVSDRNTTIDKKNRFLVKSLNWIRKPKGILKFNQGIILGSGFIELKSTKKTGIATIVFFNSMIVCAQDTLILKNNTQQVGFVFEVTPTVIKYKKLKDTENPISGC